MIAYNNLGKKTAVCVALSMMSLAVVAGSDAQELQMEPETSASRWHLTVGARLAPGLKANAHVSSKAVANMAGRLASRGAAVAGKSPAAGTATSRHTTTSDTTDSTTAGFSVSPTGRYEFDNGFIDMNDDAGIVGETSNWHFDNADAFDEGTGRITATRALTETSYDSATIHSESSASFDSKDVSIHEKTSADIAASSESDVWGGDIEIGYDLYQGGCFSFGLAVGATLYRSEDAIHAVGRCYEASSTTRRSIVTGHYSIDETRDATIRTETAESTVFTDPNLAYVGACADIENDDGSIGAGTADGYSNPYGGNNPVLKVSNGSVVQSVTRNTHTETTISEVQGFVLDRKSSENSRTARFIDVIADGDVELSEIRLALQPSWQVTEWLQLRGSLGAVASRVSVDVDSTIFVNGSARLMFSADDDKWLFAGLGGLDVVVSPSKSLDIVAGVDMRLGDRKFNYEAGPVSGRIELAGITCRLGVSFSF